MAILVALAGAGIGSATGIGGSLGWTIGSMLGSLLFPSKGATSEGPRLGDLAVSSSAYGQIIPIGYGTVRTSGNIIWSSGIRETRHKQKSGGKGGGAKQTAITYTYSVDFAISFCEGPIEDILRLWADGKLIYDKRGTNTNTKKQGLKFTIYKGSETQLQDPIIVADKGASLTPAFRGQCYLVFDDLQLADFGNRIPSITAEIAFSSEVNRLFVPGDPLSTGEGGLSSTFQNTGILVDFDRGLAYVRTSSPSRGIRRVNLRTMKEDRQIFASEMLDTGSGENLAIYAWAVAPDGAIVHVVDDGGVGGNFMPISRFDPNTFVETDRFGFNAVLGYAKTSPLTFEVATKFGFCSGYDETGRVDFLVAGTTFGAIGVLKYPTLEYVWGSETFEAQWGDGTGFPGAVMGIAQGAIKEGEGETWILGYNGSTDVFTIYKMTVQTVADYTIGPIGAEDNTTLVDDASYGVTMEVMAEIPITDISPTASSDVVSRSGNLVYDETDGGVIFMSETDEGRYFCIKWRDDAVQWITEMSLPGTSNGDNSASNFYSFSRVRGGTLGFVHGNSPILIDTASGELIEDGESPDYSAPSNNLTVNYGVYDSDTESFIGLNSSTMTGRWYFRRGAGQNAVVADIVEDICGRVGLEVTDLDVSDLTDDEVPGYIIGSRTSARSAIEPLSTAYFFDGVESDYILKFVQRGNAAARTITQDEFAILDQSTGEYIRESRQQEVELPERLTVLYMDKTNDYQQGTQSSKRLRNPVPSMFSHNQLSMSFPIVQEAEFMKQLAEKALYCAWTERVSYEVHISWKHLDLDPTDVLTLELTDGTVFTSRITQLEVGEGFMINATGVSERAAQYGSTVSADAGTGPLTQEIRGAVITQLLLLDTPLLRDSDESAGRATNPLYYFMGSYGNVGWRNGLLYKSAENTNYAQVGQSLSPMTWGTAINTLADPPDGNPFATDAINTLRVSLYSDNDTIASITYEEMLNGANPAMLIKANGEVEVIQFQTATLEVDGTYTLSNLLRGRRGTDTMCFDHTAGETFLFLDPDDGDKFPLSLGEVNQSRYYKAVSSGDFLEDGQLVTKTAIGRALMPYAPAHYVAELAVGDDLDLSWVRRTRLGGDWNNGTATIPLNEDTEEYEIDILDGPAGAIVRTVTALSTAAYTYDAADQTSDGFVPPLSELTFKVYQVSAQVGRGFSQEYTVEVT